MCFLLNLIFPPHFRMDILHKSTACFVKVFHIIMLVFNRDAKILLYVNYTYDRLIFTKNYKNYFNSFTHGTVSFSDITDKTKITKFLDALEKYTFTFDENQNILSCKNRIDMCRERKRALNKFIFFNALL